MVGKGGQEGDRQALHAGVEFLMCVKMLAFTFCLLLTTHTPKNTKICVEKPGRLVLRSNW